MFAKAAQGLAKSREPRHTARVPAAACVGAEAMAWYRLYFFSSRDKIARAMDMECADDDEAVRCVADHPHKFGLELWQGARRVRRFEPRLED